MVSPIAPFEILSEMPPPPDVVAARRRAEAAAKAPKAAPATELPAGIQPATELANAHRLVAAHGDDLRHAEGLGWLAWDGRRWSRDGARAEAERRMHAVAVALGDAAAALVRAAGRAHSDAEAKALRGRADALLRWARRSQSRRVIEAGLALARVIDPIAARADDFDGEATADWLTATNGTIDLRTGDLRAHRRDDLITRLAPVAYDPAAQAPTWQAFLRRVFGGDDELIAFVQRAAGYSATGCTGEQCFFVCHGGGANGKSTLLEALGAVLGDYAATTSSDTLLASRGRGPDNDVARLRGARFAAASEAGEGRRLDEERVKRLTGGDTVTARYLYHEWFSFRPTAKLWLACNERPEIRGTNLAIWRRVRLVPFEVTIPPNEQDRELPAKLRDEAPGILRWVVEGAKAWRRDGLGAPATVLDATAGYQAEQDVIGRFIGERCMVLPEASAMGGALYAAYREWAGEMGEAPMSATAFGRRLGADGRWRREHTERGKLWRGLGLLADDPGGRHG